MTRWWLGGLVALSLVGAAHGQGGPYGKTVRMPRFLVGDWSAVLYGDNDLSRRPADLNCDDSNVAPKAEALGISVRVDGQIVWRTGEQACALFQLDEGPLDLFENGPTWSFVGRCEKPTDPTESLPPIARGELRVEYWPGGRVGRPVLWITIKDKEWAASRPNLFNMDGRSLGRFMRCKLPR